jgi:hypothetical protein
MKKLNLATIKGKVRFQFREQRKSDFPILDIFLDNSLYATLFLNNSNLFRLNKIIDDLLSLEKEKEKLIKKNKNKFG